MRTHVSGRGHVKHNSEDLTAFLRRRVRLHRLFSLFRDIRRDLSHPTEQSAGHDLLHAVLWPHQHAGRRSRRSHPTPTSVLRCRASTRWGEDGRQRHNAAACATVTRPAAGTNGAVGDRPATGPDGIAQRTIGPTNATPPGGNRRRIEAREVLRSVCDADRYGTRAGGNRTSGRSRKGAAER